jgi:hypothetical protein
VRHRGERWPVGVEDVRPTIKTGRDGAANRSLLNLISGGGETL